MKKEDAFNFTLTTAMKVETTGPIPGKDTLKAVAIMPVYPSYERDRCRMPFFMDFKRGHSFDYGRDALEQWWTRMDDSRRSRTICFDYRVDHVFMRWWLGDSIYFDYFEDTGRDVLSVASYLNERAELQGEDRPFLTLSLANICLALNIQRPKHSDVLVECDLVMEAYRKLLYIMPIGQNSYWHSLPKTKEKKLQELKEKYEKEDKHDLRS